MSCDKCEDEPIRGAFYRWKTANVEIVACKEHWLEIREALNKAQSLEVVNQPMQDLIDAYNMACEKIVELETKVYELEIAQKEKNNDSN